MIRFIAIRTATLLVCILAHIPQSAKSGYLGGYDEKCLRFCESKRDPGNTGEFHADCNAPDFFMIKDRCLNDCGDNVCPDNKCPNGQYVICPPQKSPGVDPESSNGLNTSKDGGGLGLIIWLLIGFALVMLVCCAGGCIWYYYSSKRRLRGNGQQQQQQPWQSQSQNNFSQQQNQYPAPATTQQYQYPPPTQQYQYQAPAPPPAAGPVKISTHYTTPTGEVQRI